MSDLEYRIALAETRVRDLRLQLDEAEAFARAEVADLARVSTGLSAIWLRLTGGADEAIAREEGEASAAVALLEAVRAEMREAVAARDAVTAERTGRPVLPEEVVRLDRAVDLGTSVRFHLERALALLESAGDFLLTSSKPIHLPSDTELSRCEEHFRSVRLILPELDAALASFDCPPPKRDLERLHLREFLDQRWIANGTVREVFPRIRSAIRQLRGEVQEDVRKLGDRRLALLAAHASRV